MSLNEGEGRLIERGRFEARKEKVWALERETERKTRCWTERDEARGTVDDSEALLESRQLKWQGGAEGELGERE